MTDNEKNLKNQVLALAGIAQAAALVDKLARTGTSEAEAFHTMVYALLETNPTSAESVFINRQHLRLGLETLRRVLYQSDIPPENTNNSSHDYYNYGEILRYILSMIHLEKKLSNDKEMLNTVGKRIAQVKRQIEHFKSSGINDAYGNENVLANIASVYADTISSYRFRIQVNGNPNYLQQEQIVHKIRCLLLCGIRSAVLWKQMNGNRFKILFNRKQHAEMATELLRNQ